MRIRSVLGVAGSLTGLLVLANAGCGGDDSKATDPVVPEADGGVDAEPDSAPDATTAKAPGGACSCDDECAAFEGYAGLCVYGMCALEAAAPCPARAVPDGCPESFLCYNSDMLEGRGTCWPPFDAATCEGVENRHEVCSAVRGDDCDVSCGAVCEPTPPPAGGQAGAACASDFVCGYVPDGECYSDDSEINRFIGGYCLAFGCTSDDQCGDDAACVPMASDGSGVCLNACSNDLDCRPGYVCSQMEDDNQPFCFPGCDAAATCPAGYVCEENDCIPEDVVCSPENPLGFCPEGFWCDKGSCNDQPFACDGDDALEPNDALGDAKDAALGMTYNLTICDGDEDWFRVEVPANTIAKVGIQFLHGQGDLDLVVYDEGGDLVGSRVGADYPYPASWRDYETGTEYYGLFSQAGGSVYYVRAVGYGGATAAYGLEVAHYPFVDGPDCEAAGYTTAECIGTGSGGSGLLPFPFPDPNDTYVGSGYQFDTVGNYRFGRREVIMAVRHALHETEAVFGPADPLGIIDFADITGTTPGYDVDDPRHPESTHDQGGNIDLAYWQTDGTNDSEVVCNDGSVHNDGFCSPAAVDTHIVDLERQAFFMAKLNATPRLRVIGVDQVIAPLIKDTADALAALPDGDPKKITSAERNLVKSKMAYGSGWPFHHHHIHVSFEWWGRSLPPAHDAQPPSLFRLEPQRARDMQQLQMTWPPAPRR